MIELLCDKEDKKKKVQMSKVENQLSPDSLS